MYKFLFTLPALLAGIAVAFLFATCSIDRDEDDGIIICGTYDEIGRYNITRDSLLRRINQKFPNRNTVERETGKNFVFIGFYPPSCHTKGASVEFQIKDVGSDSCALRMIMVKTVCHNNNPTGLCEYVEESITQKIITP